MVGGTENHVHILLSLPATMPLAKAMQLVKGASSHWMNETFKAAFGWQEGYGAFTVGVSQKKRHHRLHSRDKRNIIASEITKKSSWRS